jgi:hypothetical protein
MHFSYPPINTTITVNWTIFGRMNNGKDNETGIFKLAQVIIPFMGNSNECQPQAMKMNFEILQKRLLERKTGAFTVLRGKKNSLKEK